MINTFQSNKIVNAGISLTQGTRKKVDRFMTMLVEPVDQ